MTRPGADARHTIAIAAFALLYGLAAVLVDNSYYQLVMTVVLIWAVAGLAWNLLSGYSGLISFGHAAFFGLGAYFVVLSQIGWNLTPWLGVPLAGLIGAAAGLIVGLPTFRLRGHYFALAMLAYPLALLYVFEWLGLQEVAVPMVREAPAVFAQLDEARTYGIAANALMALGLDAPGAFMQFDGGRVHIFIALALLIAAMALTRTLERGRFGRAMLAIKQDETAAEAAGIPTLAWKLKAITMSGAMAAVAGGFYAVVQLIVTPSSVFGMLVSAQALIVAMFGGVGTVWGPVIGALTLVPLSAWLDAEFSAQLPGIQGVIFGLAIVGVIMLAPEGLFWKVRDLGLRRRPRARRPEAGPPAAPPVAGPAAPREDFSVAAPGDDEGPVLEARGLSRSFGGLRAVDDVNLSVERGEILGIIGPNGAGKTTLFNLLNGLDTPGAGRVLLEGADVAGLAPNRICRRGVGRTFQVVKAFNRMSVVDNVTVGAYAHARDEHTARALAMSALEVVGLSDAAGLVAGSITNEQLRLMELARALASKPRVLLLDEIFAGLASAEVDRLIDVIRKLRTLGITIVIIEHTMRAMVRLVDRFVVLDHGTVLAAGPPDEITKNPAVIEAYLGKKWIEDAQD